MYYPNPRDQFTSRNGMLTTLLSHRFSFTCCGTVGVLLISSVTQGEDSRRDTGASKASRGVPLAGRHAGTREAPFENSFSSLSVRGQSAGLVSCMTGSPVFTSLASIQGQSKVGRPECACKYDIMGLLCYLPSLNDIHANLDQFQN